jgi:hypothetical protein
MRQRFPLPDSPSQVKAGFDKLCRAYPPDQIYMFRIKVAERLQELEGSEELVGPNARLAGELAGRCNRLLDCYDELVPARRALAIGAVSYFIAKKDAVPDPTPIIGFDDDVAVMNHVLELLELPELYIESSVS